MKNYIYFYISILKYFLFKNKIISRYHLNFIDLYFIIFSDYLIFYVCWICIHEFYKKFKKITQNIKMKNKIRHKCILKKNKQWDIFLMFI